MREIVLILFFLVENGAPKSLVVIPEDPSEQARVAANDFLWHIEKLSGARLPLKTEAELTQADRNGALVAIGATRLAKEAGIDVSKLPPEGYVVRSAANRLFLLGRQDVLPATKKELRGTYYAVSSFLERDLGVRWLWPGELGTVVPERKTLPVPAIDRTGQPKLAQRKIRNALTNRKFIEGMKYVPTDPAQRQRMIGESDAWLRRMGVGTRVQIHAGHAFTRWYERYGEEHPDYFALHLNGSREWKNLGKPKNVKICVSNPAVVEQWIANAKELLKRNPSRQSFSASANDGYYTGHCTCDRCRSWDEPGAPDTYTFYDVTAQGRTTYRYVSLTDRYLRFYNRLAEALQKAAPGKFVGGYAYGTWRALPLREKVHPNVIVGFVGLGYFDEERREKDLAYWDGWSQLAERLYLRPNLLHGGNGLPAVYVHKLAHDLRRCFDSGMFATDFDSLAHHWATQGLNYYVLAKLLADPRADVDRIVDEYCRVGFGAAADHVKGYFAQLEKLTDRIAREFPEVSKRLTRELELKKRVRWYHMAPTWYTTETLEALEVKLDAAERLAEDEAARARVRFLRDGLLFAKLRAEALSAWLAMLRMPRDDRSAIRAARKSVIEKSEPLKSYYRHHATTWVICPQLVRMISLERPVRPRKK